MTSALPLIDVDRLRLGMYVVLDVGWRNHPFLRNSFTISSEEQLRQLRELGPRQIHYSPERSTAEPLPEPVAAPAAPASGTRNPDIVQVRSWTEIEPLTEARWEENTLQRTEDEYLQVAKQHQQLHRLVASEPQQARELADAISDTLFHAVSDNDRPGLRLLSQRVGTMDSGHELAVSTLAVLLARECGVDEDGLREIGLAGLLHDIGKSRIPSFLHEDGGRLTGFERRSYQQHVALGVALAKPMRLPAPVLRMIAEHHEHYDGSGFPAALRAEAIAFNSRILAIANRYMNLICPLHAEAGLTPHQALQQMYGAEKAHFDASLLARFVRLLGVYPPGSLVELSDRRMAIVVAARPGASLTPRVQVIQKPDEELTEASIELQPEGDLKVLRSLPPAQLNPRWAQRARSLARSPLYIEPMGSPEWAAWSASADVPTASF